MWVKLCEDRSQASGACSRYTYERSAIEEWLQQHDRSPVEPEKRLDRNKELVPNLIMRAHLSMFYRSANL